MDEKGLFNGIAVAIDDEVNEPDANIATIINQIESSGIPVLKYTALPENFKDVVSHFQNLSFLLLDWRLIKNSLETTDIEEGIQVPATIQEYDASENMEFIKAINEKCFCPIFLFTNENIEDIKAKLTEEELIKDNKPSNLLIESKGNLQKDGSLFEKVADWLKQTPSLYALREWEREYQNCKTRLFSDFHAISPLWPTVMWNNFEKDGANKSLELGELISRNLHSRMTPFEFDNNVLNQDVQIPKNELRQVLEGERYLARESIHDTDIGTGDLFKEKDQKDGISHTKYYLNIRAQCDLLRTEDNNPELYVISGYILEQKDNGKISNISFNQGQYLEKPHQSIVAFIDGGHIVEFKFNEFEIKKWDDVKGIRVGRLLPPYITKIQQRYALYMQRQGLPRIPDNAI